MTQFLYTATLLFGVLFLTVACEPNELEIDNLAGKVVGIGPITAQQDGAWDITISVYDYEGNPVDVTASYQNDSAQWVELSSCANAAAPCLQSLPRGLSTPLDGTAKSYHLLMQPGDLSLETVRFKMFVEDEADATFWPQP